MNYKHVLPVHLQDQLEQACAEDEKILYSLNSDLDHDRNFGESYVSITDKNIYLMNSTETVLVQPLDRVREVRVDELFGSSRLVADTLDGEAILIYYSKVMVPHFGTLCRAVNQLIRGVKPNTEEEEEQDAYCPKCRAPLPGRGRECPFCISRIAVFKRLLGLMLPFKDKLAILLFATAVTVVIQLIPPYMTKRLVDDVIKGGDTDLLFVLIGAMAGMYTLFFMSRLTSGVMSAWLGARLVTNLRSRLHATVQRLKMGYINKRGAGYLVGRIMHDTGALQAFLVEGLPYILINSVLFVVISIILFRIDAVLTLTVFLPVPFLIIGASWFWHKLAPLRHKWGSRVSALHSVINESITGIRVVKAFAREDSRTESFDSSNESLFQVGFRIDGTFRGFQETMFWIMQLGATAVWFIGARRLLRNDPSLTLGDLLAFLGYIWLLYGPLQWFTVMFNWMSHAFTAAERIFSILDTPAEVSDAPESVSLPEIKGEIEFEDVHFSYEKGKEVIKGMSFTVIPGEMIGLVGKSGAGKSTIVNLISRFFDVDSGVVSIDGHNVRNIKLAQMRTQLGIVLQDPFLFNASILENIKYGKPEASFKEVVAAARAACAHEFILDTEYGYDTMLGEKGILLSGGERQRISIARAILHDPAVLILDEATSSVDSETEKHIQKAIENLVQGRTTIAIAHRLSTLSNADRIFFVEEGRIIEEGTHEELMSRDSNYSRLVKIQAKLDSNQLKEKVYE